MKSYSLPGLLSLPRSISCQDYLLYNTIFSPIHSHRLPLSYLRNHTLAFDDINFKELRHEAEFYGIAPLVKKLSLCAELDISGCGDVLFYSYLAPPPVPPHENPQPKPSQSSDRPGGVLRLVEGAAALPSVPPAILAQPKQQRGSSAPISFSKQLCRVETSVKA